ncbi:MAG: glutathione S-transferase family protein [Microcoleaceae cyanobacterium]
MLKLYGGAVSRASIVQLYLEELGIPYEFVQLDMKAGAHRQPDFLAINPMGKVPAIEDGEFKLWESGAILLYLADKHGQMPESVEQRAEVVQWVLFSNSTLATGMFIEGNRERETPNLMNPLNELLQRQFYITGEAFNVADVAVGSTLGFMQMMLKFDFSPYPGVMSYANRLFERPSFQKVMGGM